MLKVGLAPPSRHKDVSLSVIIQRPPPFSSVSKRSDHIGLEFESSELIAKPQLTRFCMVSKSCSSTAYESTRRDFGLSQ